jgi:DNA-directed RNA polymerase subunit RPC12/RpoP
MKTELVCGACYHRWDVARKIPVEEQIVCPSCGNGKLDFERRSVDITNIVHIEKTKEKE